MLPSICLALLPALAWASTEQPTTPANTPDPSAVIFHDVDITGDGCPDGSAIFTYSPDITYFSSAYFNMTVNLWSNSRIGNPERTLCTTTLSLEVPQGWQFTLDHLFNEYGVKARNGVNAWLQSTFAMDGHDSEVGVF
jgi:hypothetical protein